MTNYKPNCLWLLLFTALMAAGCGKAEVEEPNISLSASTVSANKRGMTYEGGDVTFEVKSNVYWVIETKSDADWLTVTPRGAYGDQLVRVTAALNPGAARSATLYFDSLDGTTAEIVVTQGSYDEMIFFTRTGMGTSPVSDEVAAGDFHAWEQDGVGASFAKFTGVNAFVSSARPSAGYDGATGGNAIRLAAPAPASEGAQTVASSFSVIGAETKDNLYFRLKVGVLAPGGGVNPEQLRVLINDGGSEYVNLDYEVLGDGDGWKEILARFFVGADNKELNFRIETSEGEYYIDDFRLYEGNSGEGDEVIFQSGADDGKEAGYVYFEDDFSWVTDVYGGTDYIGPFPASPSQEQYWNSVTAASFGQEAYDALINSGWTTDDNKLKERVYLRIGYIKMGRASNAGGSGGGLVSPVVGIKKNCTAKLKITFDCCTYVATNGTWDPAMMQVRILGPGTINDETTTVKTFLMQTATPVKWESKEFFVFGATNATQIVFESVEPTTSNRWFFDNPRIVKAAASDKPAVDLTPLTAPTVEYDAKASTESSVKFSWKAVENAAAYEYSYTCMNCGQEVGAKSGTTPNPEAEFTGLLAGTSCRVKVRALPAENDPLYSASAWSEPVEGSVKSPEQEKPDSHEPGYAFIDDDLSWVTQALCGQEDFVGNFPSSAAGVRFDSAPADCKAQLAAKGWAMTAANSSAYLYAGSIKLGTASAVGSVFTPEVSGIDAGAKVNAVVTVGGTAFLGTNSVYDDDSAAISIVGEGTFEDGTTLREFRLNSWNDWVRHSFIVKGIDNKTKFKLESRTAAKGRLFFNYFGVVKLADDYAAAQLPILATPENVTITANSAYGFDANWTAVDNATDYTYYVMLPNGQVAATGKSWEPRVHIGGLAGKNLSAAYAYFNFRVVANHMNYNSSKVEIPQTYNSSATSRAVKAAITPSSATVYFQDDFSWITTTSGSAEMAKMTDWINTYCTTDYMPRLDKIKAEGTVPLNGWDYDAKNLSVYTRPGYLHINSASALGCLISPALSGIAGTDDVLVSFDATYFYQYFSGAADTGKTLTAKLIGAGTIEGATDGVISFPLSRGNAWEACSFRITGADATTQVVFAPAAASKNRVQFDNFRAESLTK